MGLYPSKEKPVILSFEIKLDVKDAVAEKLEVAMVLDDLSEASEDKICESFRSKICHLLQVARENRKDPKEFE